MDTFRKLNTKAKKAGFSTKQILSAYAVMMIFAVALIVFVGMIGNQMVEGLKESEAKEASITKEDAEKAAQNFMGLHYSIVDSFETEKDNKKAYIIEMNYSDQNVTHGYSDYVIVVETGNPQKPMRKSVISEEEVQKLKK